eukprot:8718031-Ditylum_brightwellii.AAC.1
MDDEYINQSFFKGINHRLCNVYQCSTMIQWSSNIGIIARTWQGEKIYQVYGRNNAIRGQLSHARVDEEGEPVVMHHNGTKFTYAPFTTNRKDQQLLVNSQKRARATQEKWSGARILNVRYDLDQKMLWEGMNHDF